MKRLLRGVACCATLLACGCLHQPYVWGLPQTDLSLAPHFREAVANSYPENFQVFQRLVLTKKKTDMSVSEHIEVDRGTSFQLAILADIGTSLLSASVEIGGDVEIGRNQTRFSDRWIKENFLRDIRSLYLNTPGEDASLVQHQDGYYGLVQRTDRGTIEEFIFDPLTLQKRSFIRARAGRISYQMDYTDYGNVDGWEKEVPRTVMVRNYRRRCSARYTVKSIVAISEEDNDLQIP